MQACFQIIVQCPGFYKDLEEFSFVLFFGGYQPQLHLTSFYADPHRDLLPGQRAVAMISEMIHTASLVHDDVIDGSDQRRGKRTINKVWGERKVREVETRPPFSSCVVETEGNCVSSSRPSWLETSSCQRPPWPWPESETSPW